MKRILANFSYMLLIIVLLNIIFIQNTKTETFTKIKEFVEKLSLEQLYSQIKPRPPQISFNPKVNFNARTQNMVFPAILWKYGNEMGSAKSSGVLVSRNEKIYVITTRHSLINEQEVVNGLRNKEDIHSLVNSNDYSVIIRIGNITQLNNISIVYVDLLNDFLVAELIRPKQMLPPGQRYHGIELPIYTAQIASRETQMKISFFSRVNIVGYPGVLEYPVISEGIVNSVSENGNIGISAHVIPGNSGGPVYDPTTHELIGIVSSVYRMQTGPFNWQIVPHIGWMVSISDIEIAFELYIDSQALDK